MKEERKRVDEFAMLDEVAIEEVQGFVSAFIENKKKKLEVDNGVGDNARRRRRLQVSDII